MVEKSPQWTRDGSTGAGSLSTGLESDSAGLESTPDAGLSEKIPAVGAQAEAPVISSSALAMLTHERLHWQTEAVRWRNTAHAQRARIVELEHGPNRFLIRDLLSALDAARPFLLHADRKWDHSRVVSALGLLDEGAKKARAWLHT